MYHELTYDEIARRRRARFARLVVALVLLAVVALAVGASRSVARDQAAVSIRDSIVSAAVQCCAIEGSYPSSLSHLEEVYGVAVNHADYVVNYEWLGDNVPPSVVVRPR